MVGILDVFASALGVFSALEEGGEAMVGGSRTPRRWDPATDSDGRRWLDSGGLLDILQSASRCGLCSGGGGEAMDDEDDEIPHVTSYRRQHADSVLTSGWDALLALREDICRALS